MIEQEVQTLFSKRHATGPISRQTKQAGNDTYHARHVAGNFYTRTIFAGFFYPCAMFIVQKQALFPSTVACAPIGTLLAFLLGQRNSLLLDTVVSGQDLGGEICGILVLRGFNRVILECPWGC